MADTRQWHFYVIALTPDIHPNRLKFGISLAPKSRYAQHATAAPTARLLYTSEIPNPARVYEHLCILAGRGQNFTRIGGEVYDVDDAAAAVHRVECYLGEMEMMDGEESRENFEGNREHSVWFAEYLWNMRFGNHAEIAAEVRDQLLDILLVRWARPDAGPL